MNAMIEPSLIKKYLAGDASDEEAQQCEAFLSDPANFTGLASELDLEPLPGDSLVETLRNLGVKPTCVDLGQSRSESLIEQIQALVPRQKIGQDELDRVLSPPELEDEIGRIGPYRVIEFIAGGGMGLVFKAEDARLDRLVCIKVLHPMLAVHADSKTRFARESKAAAKLRNARITTVLEVGEHRELPFFVMELLDGSSLREKLNQEGPLEPAVAEKLTTQIAEGLKYAHGLGYLHRDIKPENIWVTTEGDAKLLDFGLARAVDETTNLTNTGTILGTPSYMSPEQVQGKELDVRSDLFSVGSVLFEMLTGRSPFEKSNLFSTMMAVANDSLEFPATAMPNVVPDRLQSIVRSLLQKSPEDRTPSADVLIDNLNGTHEPIPLTKPQGSGGSRGWAGVWGGLAGAACVAFAILMYQLNDKGTLVVEADPSVSVSIANEQVSIHDPKTGKKFKVTIGDHPLPSGVYQLEMSDESGQFTLSSSVIAIRRGEQQIVRVELRPLSVAENAPGSDVNPTVDGPAAAARPALTLASLPTLSANQLRRKLNIQQDQPLFSRTMVTEPTTRKGITSWAIDLAVQGKELQLNADGSLIASTGDDGFVAIFNRDEEPIHLIPAQDKITQVLWSPDPDVIAVVENGTRRKQIAIWKLFDDHLEAIDVIPADALKIAWSWDGLSLAVQGDSEMAFIDVSQGSAFAYPNFGISGGISEHPWSSDGRFFAATEGQSVKVWDLEERKLFHIFTSASDARFLPTGNRVAVKVSRNWEIWDLDSFQRIQLIEPSSEWLAFWPDHSFERLVAITSEKKLVAQEIQTGIQAERDLKFRPDQDLNTSIGGKFWLGQEKFHWSADGRSFVFTARWNKFLSLPQTPPEVDIHKLTDHQLLTESLPGYVPMGAGRSTQVLDRSPNNRLVYFNDLYEQGGPIAGFDLNAIEQFPSSEFSIFDTNAIYRISPDGKSVAIVGSGISLYDQGKLSPEDRQSQSTQWSKDFSQIRICSFETGKLIRTIENEKPVFDFLWSPDSASLVVTWIELVSEQVPDPKRQSYQKYVDAIIEQYDLDEDEQLSPDEVKRMRRPPSGVDQNDDGLLSSKELFDNLAKSQEFQSTKTQYRQLAAKIVTLSNDLEIRLQPEETLKDSTQVQYCFQRASDHIKVHNRDHFAKPVIFNGKLVLPAFNPSEFQYGQRSNRRESDSSPDDDRLAVFDIKTGEMVELVDLNTRFVGNRLSMTDELIMIGRPHRKDYGYSDSCSIVDRRNGKVYTPRARGVPHQSSESLIGLPFISPRYPFVAFETKEGAIQIWKLDSIAESFELIKSFPGETRNTNSKGKKRWHPSEPTIAWISDGTVNFYNVEADKLTISESVRWPQDVVPIPEGWLVVSSQEMVKLDLNLAVKRTYRPTGRLVGSSPEGVYDQCITATGEILKPDNVANLRAVQLNGNRIETLTIEEFEGQLE